MGLGKTAYYLLALVVCLACLPLPAAAASLDELTPFLSGQYFTWRESFGGRHLLTETGPLFSGGVTVGGLFPVNAHHSLTLKGKAEIFGGYVSYDGETQAPDPVPVKTDVSYLGTRQDFDLGYRYSAPVWHLEPFLGVGYRWWLRGLQNGTSDTGVSFSGYTEFWQTVYLRMGARGRYVTSSGITVFAEGGAKYPLYTGNSVDFVDTGVTTFRPVGDWSGFAETGLRLGRFKVSLSYEGFRFSASPQIQVGSRTFFQPDSSSDIYGLNLGWSF